MKKFASIVSLCLLTACIYAGDVNVLKSRNKLFSYWQTDEIDYYKIESRESLLAGTQEITEENIERGVVLTTAAGNLMASSKTNMVEMYDTEVLQANKTAVMSSSYSPIYIRKTSVFESFGEVTINGERYMLVRLDKGGDIILVSGAGEIYERIGRVVDGRLAILDIKFFVEPEDVRLMPVVLTETKTNDEVKGFELVYDGFDDNELSFSYVTLGAKNKTKQFTFALDASEVEIEGLKLQIIEATPDKISYIIE